MHVNIGYMYVILASHLKWRLPELRGNLTYHLIYLIHLQVSSELFTSFATWVDMHFLLLCFGFFFFGWFGSESRGLWTLVQCDITAVRVDAGFVLYFHEPQYLKKMLWVWFVLPRPRGLFHHSVLLPPPRYPAPQDNAYTFATTSGGLATPTMESQNNGLTRPVGPEYQLAVGEG